ncbi:MAG TPA: TonB-dependent receptor [bacterium]|nr:TonB-dependent receptor [bacterium]
MKKWILLCMTGIGLSVPQLLNAQHALTVQVTDSESGDAVPGAQVHIMGTTQGGVSNAEGIVRLENIAEGIYRLRITSAGYEDVIMEIQLPRTDANPIPIVLEHASHEGEEITVTSTRSSRTIENTPTRVEAIAAEELDEKANMRVSDIRMQLNESTGIQVQQTSVTSGNAVFRIQGLDGRYTQLLKDGFPLYAGFSGGLSITQIPPLDLQQIEIIKGSASTLYGGGAIAGLINLVSKTPQEKPETLLMVNGTTAKGFDGNFYHARRNEKIGYSVFSSAHTQSPYDADEDGFSDIPKIHRFALNPRVYYYPGERSTLMLGFDGVLEKRSGGDMQRLENGKDSMHTYIEKNRSRRLSTQMMWQQPLFGRATMTFKNSFSFFDRAIVLQDYRFTGYQQSSFSEWTLGYTHKNNSWIMGINLWTDRFDEQKPSLKRDFHSLTAGVFVQHQAEWSEDWSSEAGLRYDRDKDYGSFVLPRLSVMRRWNASWTSRLGGGLGYKSPTIFNETSETQFYRNIRGIQKNQLKAETSLGGNFDINYQNVWAKRFPVALNTMVYYTRLRHALTYDKDSLASGVYDLINSDGHIDTRGTEINGKISYEAWKLFVGYTWVDIKRHENGGTSHIPLSAKHRLGLVLVYEEEARWRVGIESYYTGHQYRSDGRSTNDFWIFGFMIQRTMGPYAVFVNFENFTDTRQSRFEALYTGTRTNPDFKELYAPTEGFVANAGLKIRW